MVLLEPEQDGDQMCFLLPQKFSLGCSRFGHSDAVPPAQGNQFPVGRNFMLDTLCTVLPTQNCQSAVTWSTLLLNGWKRDNLIDAG